MKATLFLFITSAAYAMPLKDYSVIVKNDLQGSRDIEGRTLVGNNITYHDSSNFGIKLNTFDGDTLIVMGDVLNGNPLNVNGSVALSNDTNRKINTNNGGSISIADDMTYVFAELDSFSIYLKDQDSISVTFSNGQPAPYTFIGDGPVAYFSFDGNSFFSNDKIQHVNLTGANEYVFNVGGKHIDWSAPSNMVGNFISKEFQSKIIWNFYEASTVNLRAHAIYGQILAPHGTVTTQNNIVGSVYAMNLNSNGEVHLPTYGGDLVPEPSILLTFIMGAGLLTKRKRK